MLHNTYILENFSLKDFVSFITIVSCYIFLSWICLYFFFEKITKIDLGILFLTTDIFICILAIYYTGGEKSLLFFLLLVRTADQTNTSFKRVIVFSHISILCYVFMLFYLHYVDHKHISVISEIIKLFMLYAANVYISLTARAAEKIKNRTRASMQLARNLILRLNEKTEQLNHAKAVAETANRAKSDFLANMSHELRTPLNHIIGFTEIVVGKNLGDLNEIQEEYLNDALNSGQHLLSLINDILDLSKVEAGKMQLTPSDINLRLLLESSLMMFKEKAREQGIQLYTAIDSIPESIKTDKRKLKQILYNLLSNAVKFTPDGGQVRLSARLSVTGEDKRPSEVEIGVSDTGIGLLKEDLNSIFSPFEQVEQTRSRRFHGTGLGLSLSKRLVELLGGRIWAESEGEGSGSTFKFVLPLDEITRDSYLGS
jgi:signal transduction histidine kinase